MVTVELLSDPEEGLCPSVSLDTLPTDVLDLNLIGLYAINDNLGESLD